MSRNDSIILSVSYDVELLTLREAFLRTQGCEVRSVMSIDDALVLLSIQHFDAIIVGHSVPTEDKHRLIIAIKQLWPRLPVLTIVADPQEKDKLADASVAGSAGPDALLGTLKKVMLRYPVRGTAVPEQDKQ